MRITCKHFHIFMKMNSKMFYLVVREKKTISPLNYRRKLNIFLRLHTRYDFLLCEKQINLYRSSGIFIEHVSIYTFIC